MEHHLMQITLLLVSFVIINAEPKTCPQQGIKPSPFPQEYLIGVWRVVSCTDSQVCRGDIDCPVYPYHQSEDKSIVLRARGYNETSGSIVQGEGKVTFTNKPGEYILYNFFGLKSVDIIVLHAEEHFSVMYACITDNQGVTTPAAWISTKNDPNNTLNEWERSRAAEVMKMNGLDTSVMQSRTYNNCNKIQI